MFADVAWLGYLVDCSLRSEEYRVAEVTDYVRLVRSECSTQDYLVATVWPPPVGGEQYREGACARVASILWTAAVGAENAIQGL